MEILKTIALLCQLNGAAAAYAEEAQLKCQQYYIKCLNGESLGAYKDLSKCVAQKKL
jgi:hypothetical protein